jgi:N-acyl-D-aspartate/D-glutamate deacylase
VVPVAYDLVIENGTVVDGTGGPSQRADVGVTDGRVVAVGRLEATGRRRIDAEGHVVTPGFIDGHTHLDAQVLWDPLGTSSCFHGVTTVIMGNCGFSLAPVSPGAHSLVVANLERAEDIPATALEAGIDWRWETFAEYLDTVDSRDKGINFAAYVGHSALRTWAMGERAFTEEAGADDLAQMEAELAAAIEAGAIGLTTSRSTNHETSDDRPVASRQAAWSEVQRLVGVLSRAGRGVFELAHEPVARSDDPERKAEYLGRLRALACDTGVPVTFGVLADIESGPLALIADVNAAGGTMFGQTHSRGVAVVLTFATKLAFDTLPVWREVRALPQAEQLRQLADPEARNRLVKAAAEGEYRRAIGAEARRPEFDRLYLMDGPLPPWRTVAEESARRGCDPVELMIDLAVATEFRQCFFQPLSPEDPERLLPVLRRRDAIMTFSDSGAHVSQVCDSSIQTHLLSYWVRQRQDFTLEEAVRMLTSAPAGAWGLPDRGRVAPGMMADLNVFDPDRIAPAMPEVADDLPGHTRRLRQGATGIRATVVAGEVVLEDGVPTGALPGRLLRGAGQHTAVRLPSPV